MSLKAVLASKAELDALPEAMRPSYVEKEGRFALDVDGGTVLAADVQELKTKLAEFRDNNRAMYGELEQLRPLAKKFEDIDPDEYKTLKEEIAQLKNKGIEKPADLQAAIDKAVAAHTKPLAEQLASEKKEREAAQKKVNDARFKELVSADALKAGVAQKSLRHVLREAEQMFELKDDALVPRDGVKHPTEPHKDLTLGDWFQNLAKTDDNLFEPSIGGGANGGRQSHDRSGRKQLINPSPEEMGRNVDALAKGEMTVVRT